MKYLKEKRLLKYTIMLLLCAETAFAEFTVPDYFYRPTYSSRAEALKKSAAEYKKRADKAFMPLYGETDVRVKRARSKVASNKQELELFKAQEKEVRELEKKHKELILGRQSLESSLPTTFSATIKGESYSISEIEKHVSRIKEEIKNLKKIDDIVRKHKHELLQKIGCGKRGKSDYEKVRSVLKYIPKNKQYLIFGEK